MTVYLALGSNLDHRAAHLAAGLAHLSRLGTLTGISGVYETAPVGYTDQPPFLNLVARLETELEPRELLERIRAIEEGRGRVRSFRNAPRTLDIDILIHGDRRVDEEGLTVPHPRMEERAFVLVPLVELAPELTEPGTDRRYRDRLAELPGAGPDGGTAGIQRIMDGEELLDADG